MDTNCFHGFIGKVQKGPEVLTANAMLCAVNQAAYLLKRQLQSERRVFVQSGGFIE